MKGSNALTFCVIGKIEGRVKIVDQASGTDILPVVRVALAGHGSEEEHDVVVPDDRDPFRTGRSLTPKRDLGGPMHQQVDERMNRIPPQPSDANGGRREESLAVLVWFEMKTTLRSHDSWRSGFSRKDAARR